MNNDYQFEVEKSTPSVEYTGMSKFIFSIDSGLATSSEDSPYQNTVVECAVANQSIPIEELHKKNAFNVENLKKNEMCKEPELPQQPSDTLRRDPVSITNMLTRTENRISTLGKVSQPEEKNVNVDKRINMNRANENLPKEGREKVDEDQQISYPRSAEAGENRKGNGNLTETSKSSNIMDGIEELYDPNELGVFAEMEKKVIEELMEATDYLEELLMAENSETSEVTEKRKGKKEMTTEKRRIRNEKAKIRYHKMPADKKQEKIKRNGERARKLKLDNNDPRAIAMRKKYNAARRARYQVLIMEERRSLFSKNRKKPEINDGNENRNNSNVEKEKEKEMLNEKPQERKDDHFDEQLHSEETEEIEPQDNNLTGCLTNPSEVDMDQHLQEKHVDDVEENHFEGDPDKQQDHHLTDDREKQLPEEVREEPQQPSENQDKNEMLKNLDTPPEPLDHHPDTVHYENSDGFLGESGISNPKAAPAPTHSEISPQTVKPSSVQLSNNDQPIPSTSSKLPLEKPPKEKWPLRKLKEILKVIPSENSSKWKTILDSCTDEDRIETSLLDEFLQLVREEILKDVSKIDVLDICLQLTVLYEFKIPLPDYLIEKISKDSIFQLDRKKLLIFCCNHGKNIGQRNIKKTDNLNKFQHELLRMMRNMSKEDKEEYWSNEYILSFVKMDKRKGFTEDQLIQEIEKVKKYIASNDNVSYSTRLKVLKATRTAVTRELLFTVSNIFSVDVDSSFVIRKLTAKNSKKSEISEKQSEQATHLKRAAEGTNVSKCGLPDAKKMKIVETAEEKDEDCRTPSVLNDANVPKLTAKKKSNETSAEAQQLSEGSDQFDELDFSDDKALLAFADLNPHLFPPMEEEAHPLTQPETDLQNSKNQKNETKTFEKQDTPQDHDQDVANYENSDGFLEEPDCIADTPTASRFEDLFSAVIKEQHLEEKHVYKETELKRKRESEDPYGKRADLQDMTPDVRCTVNEDERIELLPEPKAKEIVDQHTIDPQSEKTGREMLYDPSDPYGTFAEMEEKVTRQLIVAKNKASNGVRNQEKRIHGILWKGLVGDGKATDSAAKRQKRMLINQKWNAERRKNK